MDPVFQWCCPPLWIESESHLMSSLLVWSTYVDGGGSIVSFVNQPSPIFNQCVVHVILVCEDKFILVFVKLATCVSPLAGIRSGIFVNRDPLGHWLNFGNQCSLTSSQVIKVPYVWMTSLLSLLFFLFFFLFCKSLKARLKSRIYFKSGENKTKDSHQGISSWFTFQIIQIKVSGDKKGAP